MDQTFAPMLEQKQQTNCLTDLNTRSFSIFKKIFGHEQRAVSDLSGHRHFFLKLKDGVVIKQ